jgi:hypothetical protein
MRSEWPCFTFNMSQKFHANLKTDLHVAFQEQIWRRAAAAHTSHYRVTFLFEDCRKLHSTTGLSN